MRNIEELVSIFRNNAEQLKNFYENLLKQIKKCNKYKCFSKIYDSKVLKKIQDPSFYKKYKNKPLFGIPFCLKDNFNIKGEQTSSGSDVLKGFVPNFNSTVYEILINNGAILIGKVIMDELAMGGTGLESNAGYIFNCFDSQRIVGGSSSGSATAVALDVVSFALGSDTGDSVRRPAAFLGVIGFKPTFGLISRFGLLSYAPSLDTVGMFTKNIDNLEIISKLLFRFDKKDFVSQNKPNLISNPLPFKKKYKILILEPDDQMVNKESYDLFNSEFVSKLQKENFEINRLSLPSEIKNNLLFAYKIISFSEALSTQSNLSGINFGFSHPDTELDFFERIMKNRSSSFKKEIKRRYVLGSFFNYKQNQKDFFWKALKFKGYLTEYFNNLFTKYDYIVHLSTSDIAPLVKDVEQSKTKPILKPLIDDYLIIANFLGLPSINLPFAKKQKLPLGINIFSQFNHDFALLNFAKKLIKIINFQE